MKEPTSTEDAIRIVERFDTLPVGRRVDIFRGLSAQAREELIEVIARPGEITRHISEEEMFFTIKELGGENALGLLAATTGKQLLYLLDIDLWKKDQFDAEMAGHWLDIISRIGENKILQFLQVVDPELLITALRPLIRVEIRDPDTDLAEQRDSLPSFTLEDVFFLDFLDSRWEESLRLIAEMVFRWKPEYYFGLMEELARGEHLANEELALKWRLGRLSDHGIPVFEEALEVYNYVGHAEINQESQESPVSSAQGSDGPLVVLDYPLKLLQWDDFFSKCLPEIDDPNELDRITVQLAHLANKVIIADGRDPGSVNQVYGSLSKVSGLISVALEDVCGKDMARGVQMLRANHLEMLFRRGFSLVQELAHEARAFVTRTEGGVENLGTPLAGLLSALLQKRPRFGGVPPADAAPREFRSMDDLEIIRRFMSSEAAGERWEPL